MIENKELPPPRNWHEFRQSITRKWLTPFLFVDWLAELAAYWLGRTSLLQFLEYCGSFSILVAVIFYFVEWPDRTKSMHYQAWQVINTAQGKGGSGGRAEALQELNDDHVALVGVDVSNAFLQGLSFTKADIRRCDMRGTDLKNADLSRSDLEQSDLESANLRDGNFTLVKFSQASLKYADLTNANLTNCNVMDATLESADLTNANLAGLGEWMSIKSIRLANIHGVRNAPAGFSAWAKQNGAIDQ